MTHDFAGHSAAVAPESLDSARSAPSTRPDCLPYQDREEAWKYI